VTLLTGTWHGSVLRMFPARHLRRWPDSAGNLVARRACFGGSLSNQWTVPDFSPNEYLPKGVRLAGYFGDAADLPREAFQEILDAVAAGRLAFPLDRVYDGLELVPQAHDDMEHDRATGKLVVRVRH
jgi:NADPH:quinone reductase